MNRRAFLSALAALPVVGRLVKGGVVPPGKPYIVGESVRDAAEAFPGRFLMVPKAGHIVVEFGPQSDLIAARAFRCMGGRIPHQSAGGDTIFQAYDSSGAPTSQLVALMVDPKVDLDDRSWHEYPLFRIEGRYLDGKLVSTITKSEWHAPPAR